MTQYEASKHLRKSRMNYFGLRLYELHLKVGLYAILVLATISPLVVLAVVAILLWRK